TAGLDKLLEVLQGALDGKVFGISLPLIGSSLKDGAQFIQKIRDQLVPALEGNGARTIGILQQAIFNSLGPAGLNILLLNKDYHDQGGDGVPDAAPDYRDVENDSAPDHVQFNLRLHSALVETS